MEHKKGCAGTPLESILTQRDWLLRSKPFKHVTAQEVFLPEFYASLESGFRSILRKGLSEQPEDNRFSRNMRKYDAYGYCFQNAECGPFEVFFEQQWHDTFVRLFNTTSSGDVEVCLHHHSIGGDSGNVHNDLNDSWFPEKRNGGINVATNVHVQPSTPPKPGQNQRLVMRSIAILIYLNNPPWERGDGGETGLYTYRDQPVDQPERAVPPRNNSLLAFECTPYSYHSFISNVSHPRNSLIMWIHRDFKETCDAWGAENIIWWHK